MDMKEFLGLDCKEATNACHRAEYNEAGFADKVRLKIHLFLCSPCKAYKEENKKLSYLLKKATIHSCSREEKNALHQRILDQRSNTSKND